MGGHLELEGFEVDVTAAVADAMFPLSDACLLLNTVSPVTRGPVVFDSRLGSTVKRWSAAMLVIRSVFAAVGTSVEGIESSLLGVVARFGIHILLPLMRRGASRDRVLCR